MVFAKLACTSAKTTRGGLAPTSKHPRLKKCAVTSWTTTATKLWTKVAPVTSLTRLLAFAKARPVTPTELAKSPQITTSQSSVATTKITTATARQTKVASANLTKREPVAAIRANVKKVPKPATAMDVGKQPAKEKPNLLLKSATAKTTTAMALSTRIVLANTKASTKVFAKTPDVTPKVFVLHPPNTAPPRSVETNWTTTAMTKST